MRTVGLLSCLVLIGCRSQKDLTDADSVDMSGLSEVEDVDGDGYDADSDCDDNNSLINPGAVELCDGFDNDCDGTVDENVTSSYYADTDGDGFGDPDVAVDACEQPEGHVPIGNDCNDDNALSYPGAAERCDGEDNDCDGMIDEDLLESWYLDGDGDGFGDPKTLLESCDPGSEYIADNSDCDDTDSGVNPDATEICNEIDDDCDLMVDEDVTTTWYVDRDGDTYGDPDATTEACSLPTGYSANAGDCDDLNSEINPAEAEICNEIDDDCDLVVDEGVTTTFYADTDSDGYGDIDSTTEACSVPSGYQENSTDCDDTNGNVNPAETEICNEIDDDCDSSIDEGVTTTFYADTDSDGYGDIDSTTEACSVPSGYQANSTDCDDTNGNVNPAETEICNEIDDDCDLVVDEDVTTTFYADTDSDGYGDIDSTTEACSVPSGYQENSTDCDDTNGNVNPAETEICNEIDDDCDSSIDEGVTTTFYADTDSDGYGDIDSTTEACSVPSGYQANSTDCDDTNGNVNPAETEICNEIDDDCDSSIDEGVTTTYYLDDDGDGYGDIDNPVEACSAPSSHETNSADCDDTDAYINPSESELCNGIDDDCDGDIDEDAASPDVFYADADGDGFGDASNTVEACEAPTGYTDDDMDCDDGDASINPDATESCNSEDDDCDGTADEGILGTGAACAADSCLDILMDNSSASDGEYWVWFDSTETETTCDMNTDGGGWTLIFEDDFESTPDSGWSLSSRYACGSWSTILGGYGIIAGGEIDITLSAYSISHSEAWVELEYLAIDSWDGELAYVDVDSTTIWSVYQDNHSTSYSEVCGWNRGYYGSYDSMHSISSILSHTANSIDLIGGSTLNQANTDESFGLDDVMVWIR